MKFFIYNEVIFQLTFKWKIHDSEEHLVSILSFSQTPKYETQQQSTFKTLLGNIVLNDNF